MAATATPRVYAAREADRDRLIAIIAHAFATDPAARGLYPDKARYRRHFPDFIRAFGGRAIDHGTAFYTEGFGGAALWLPPGVESDEEALDGLMETTVPERERGIIGGVIEEMGRYHPEVPHWYLPLIGVEPRLQGQGHGSALMAHALKVCDRAGQVAYLESSSPRNVPLYERFGFALLGVIRHDSFPPIHPMLRAARRTV